MRCRFLLAFVCVGIKPTAALADNGVKSTTRPGIAGSARRDRIMGMRDINTLSAFTISAIPTIPFMTNTVMTLMMLLMIILRSLSPHHGKRGMRHGVSGRQAYFRKGRGSGPRPGREARIIPQPAGRESAAAGFQSDGGRRIVQGAHMEHDAVTEFQVPG